MYSDNITSSGSRSHYCICLILNKINPEKYNTQLAIANKNFTKAFDSRKAFNRIFPRTGKTAISGMQILFGIIAHHTFGS